MHLSNKIVIIGPGYTVEIIDAKALKDFHFGPGPGNFIGFPPASSPNWKSNSWIVEDWDNPAAEPEQAFSRLKVSFHIDTGNSERPREYVAYYVYDSAAQKGYVYLPGMGDESYLKNVNILYRGEDFEGHWFRATPEWSKEVQVAIERAGR